ncbi:catalase A [Steccherinum ochraceum]|uniref:Catalase n=1 Tax=Steccherinum ochraceum TaxID=92696 RepID=A0A4R0S0T2_9APHY|nr:catalase A [Steccherinum ochraceum]
MSGVAGAVKQAYTAVTQSQKIADLQRNTVDPEKFAKDRTFTTDFGVAVSNTDDWLKAANSYGTGPSLLEDHIAREKIHRFDHERIPERVVHARGAAAHGVFKVYDDKASKYTSAGVLTDPSRTTPVFVRFSTVQGSRGSADTVRDVRGFATKFYTEEGNWDIVGNDIPIFFIQDAIKFPDIIHAVKPEPKNEVPQGQSAHNNFWDFVGLQPEATHMALWVMSDRGIPRSFRMMQGFGVNTYTLVNASGERFFVKFHWIPELGVHSLMWDEAMKLGGQDPDFHRKDLEEAINTGAYPKWQFGIQVIPEADEHNFEFDILDATKVWPEELVPLQVIGEMELNRTVDEYFPETEQVAFCTSHIVPGIGFSDDPLLQGRNFSYQDTQITRLGVNWEELPINRPVCPMLNTHRDGAMRHRIVDSNVNYWPNRKEHFRPVPVAHGGYNEHPQKVQGVKERMRGKKFQEHFNQATFFLNSLTPAERLHLTNGISFELSHCDDPVVYETYTRLLNNVDFDFAKDVATIVGGIVPKTHARENHGKSTPTLSQTYYHPKVPTIKSRRIAILVGDGFDLAQVQALRAAFKAGSATTWLIGPNRGPVYPEGVAQGDVKNGVLADHQYEGQRSTAFDAVVIPAGMKSAQALARNGRAVHWVREAFGHCKAIGAIGEGVAFVREAAQLPGVEYATNLDSHDVVSSYGVVTVGKVNLSSIAADVLKISQSDKGFVSSFAYEVSQHRCWARELDGLTDKVAY